MNTRNTFARVIAGTAMAVMTLMPGDAFAFLGLFETKPTKVEMEKMDALFNGYYKAPDVEAAIAILPSVKKMNKIKPGGIPPMIGFYFGAAKSSAEAWREKWERGEELRWQGGGGRNRRGLGGKVH